ncbi:MAG: hypothetical protein ACFFD5_03880 [Candidatus Thorarchaeota archaeon]
MENREKLKEIIKREIYKLRNLGEHARKGTDHLYYRTLTKFKINEIKKLVDQERINYEVICIYEIYTETEFLHTPDMDDLYTEHYKDRFVLNKDFSLLEIKDLRINK